MTAPHWALDTAKAWAQERLRSGAEPPWTYYRLMQLVEAVESLTAGARAVTPTGCSQQEQRPRDDIPPQGENIYRLDIAQSRRAEQQVQMPT